MKRGLILLAALVIVSGVALGASLSWRGSLYTASGTGDYGVGLTDGDGVVEKVSWYFPGANVQLVFYADGDTVVPYDPNDTDATMLGDSDAYITAPAGVPMNEYSVRADSMYVVRTIATEGFIYWR